jgi:hypothetical protein
MRSGVRGAAVAGVVLATCLLTACTPSVDEVVGTWQHVDGAVLTFEPDRTFAASGLDSAVLLTETVDSEDVPADLAGTWYVESPFEDVCEEGETVKVFWGTEPVVYADAFCLVGRGADAVLVVTSRQDETPAVLDFTRAEVG